jgi:transcriptional adapter 2-alpha
LLLEGAEVYGLGSWADIADHIGGFRTKEEVRDHYIDTYVKSSKFPLPERADPNDTTLLDANPRDEFQAKKKRRIEERKEAAKTAPPVVPKQKPTTSIPKCHEVQGYMPGRLEFETEFANEAEETVKHMQFDPGDGINPRTGEIEPEMELKMAVMDIYNSRLTARAERKKVIFEHNLLEYHKNVQIHKERTKDERKLFNKVKPFAQMMGHKEFSEAATGFQHEHDLRQAISTLEDWRSVRIRDLKSGERYETEKHIRAHSPAATRRSDRIVALPQPIPPMKTSFATALTAPELPEHLKSSQLPIRARSGPLPTGTATSTQYITPPIPGVAPLELTLENAAELQLLTKEERELCSMLRMMPKAYIAIKDGLLREAMKTGGSLRKEAVGEVCKVCDMIYDFRV